MKQFWDLLNYLGYVLAIVGTLCSDLDAESKFILTSALLLGLCITALVIVVFKTCTLTYGWIFINAIIIYFSLGFVWKVLLLLYFAEDAWIADLVSRNAVRQTLPLAFLTFLVGYCAILFVFLVFRQFLSKKFEITFSTIMYFRISFALQLVVSLLLLIKLFLMTQYQIGVMGDKPKDLGIPYLSGFFSLLMDADYRFFISVLILFAIRNSSWGQKAAVITFTLADIALGTGVGASKHVAVYYMMSFLFIMYYFAKASGMGGVMGMVKANRVLLTMTASIGILLALAYPYINTYRYYSVYQHKGIESAISNIKETETESENILMLIANRINGIENLEAGILLMNDGAAKPFTFGEFFSGDIAYKFAEKITDSATLFGLTEFGYMYIYNGTWFVLFGSLVLGLVLLLGLYLTCSACRVAEIRFLAFVGYLIMALNLLMGAGDMLLLIKEFMVYLVFVYYFDRWIWRRTKAVSNRESRLVFAAGECGDY